MYELEGRKHREFRAQKCRKTRSLVKFVRWQSYGKCRVKFYLKAVLFYWPIFLLIPTCSCDFHNDSLNVHRRFISLGKQMRIETEKVEHRDVGAMFFAG